MFIVGIADGIRANGAMIYDAVSSLTSTIFAAFENMFADLIESVIGPNPIADAIRENAAGLEAAAQESSDKVHDAFDSRYGEIESEANDMMNNLKSTMSSGSADVNASLASIGTEGIQSIQNPLDMLKSSIPSSISSIAGSLMGSSSQMGEAGSAGGEMYSSQLLSMLESGGDEAVGQVESMVSEMGQVDSSGAGTDVGNNFGSGVSDGISGWLGPVAAAAAALVEAAKAAANSAMNAASPAKDLIESGGWFAQGFMIGIQNNTRAVALAASDMTAAAKAEVSGFNSLVMEALTGLDWDSQPVISPVLDLTNINDGMGRLDSILASNNIVQAGWANRVAMAVPSGSGTSIQNAPTYIFNLDYGAGDDAVTMFMELASMMQSFNRLEA